MPNGQPMSSWSATAFSRVFGESAARLPPGLPYRTIVLLPTAMEDRLGVELWRMGRATEALATRMGEGAGGLLNATFGNAAELIIAVIALSKGLSSVVKASIAGSIIGNILLVLGLSILCLRCFVAVCGL